MKVIKFLFVIFNLLSIEAFDTSQTPEKVVFLGKEYPLVSSPSNPYFPLEDYFQKYPNKKPKPITTSTGFKRGYVGTYEIIDGQLFLVDLKIELPPDFDKGSWPGWKSVFSEVFEGKQKVKVDWFDGIILLPQGQGDFGKMDSEPNFDNYVIMEIEDGDIKFAEQFGLDHYKEFKHKQFLAFKETKEYQRLIKRKVKSTKKSPEYLNRLIEDEILKYTSKVLIEN